MFVGGMVLEIVGLTCLLIAPRHFALGKAVRQLCDIIVAQIGANLFQSGYSMPK